MMARPGVAPFSTTASAVEGGWTINGRKIFASLAGAADYYGILCGEPREGEAPSRSDTMYIAVPADAPGVEVIGRLGSARHARHGLAHHPVQGRVRRRRRRADAARHLLPGGAALAAHVPDPVADLPRSRPGRLRLHRALPARRDRRHRRGEAAPSPAKQLAVAQMFIMLQQIKALWFQAVSEARVDPTQGTGPARARRAVHGDGGRQRPAQLALRTCGGRSLLKSLPARTPLSRQPLRLGHAALDGRAASNGSAAKPSTSPASRTSSVSLQSCIQASSRCPEPSEGPHAASSGMLLATAMRSFAALRMTESKSPFKTFCTCCWSEA